MTKCKYCSKEVVQNRKPRVKLFCDINCYTKYRKEKRTITLICKNCGVSFKRSKSQQEYQRKKGSDTRYCSRKCQGEATTRKGTQSLICKNCGTTFTRINARCNIGWKDAFCSKSCNITYQNEHPSKEYRSKLEKYIERKLKKKYPQLNIKFNDRKTLRGKELDIFFPDMKLAIELHGIFHYEPINGKRKLKQQQNSDKKRRELCKKQGIRLIEIDNLTRFTPEFGEEIFEKIVSYL